MYVCTSLFSVIFLHYTFENILYLFTPPLFLPSDFVFYLLLFRSPFSATIRSFSTIFRLFYSAGCVSLTYFDLLRFGYCFPGLLSLGSSLMKCPISPWLRCSMSRCYCYNLQVELGFLFSLGFLAWSG